MKKIILFSALSLFLTAYSLAGTNNDAPDPEFSIIQNGWNLKVLYKGTEPHNVKVSIFDSKEHRVFTEAIKHTDGFARPYNLENLPEGEYVVEVSDETGASRKNVVVAEKHTGRTFNLVKVHRAEDKLLLTVGKYSKGFQVRIEDRNGKTIYSEKKNIDGDFAQVYDIASLSGGITVFVSDENGNREKFEF